MNQLPKKLSEHYLQWREALLPFRRYKHQTILDLIAKHKQNSGIQVEEIGRSIEGRPIQSLTLGSGSKKILLWTQMHGNESTATRGVFDFLNCFGSGEINELDQWLKEVQIKFVPVLNPDGLERYQRRNALNIDPNRDAARITTPEIKVLFDLAQEYQPDWCFNMHDQRNLFNVSGTGNPATISFLSPSTSDGKRNQNQQDGMMMIDRLNQMLSEHIPGKVGRFTHEYYPTASGDNFQSRGYRTVLVESGGYPEDVEREMPRKMNFLLICEVIRLVAESSWNKGTTLRYAEIPENDQKLFDLLIRNAAYDINGNSIKVDIGIDRVEIPATTPEGFVYKSSVRDVGDLSHFWGYEEMDATGLTLSEILTLNQVADFELSDEKRVVKVSNGFIL